MAHTRPGGGKDNNNVLQDSNGSCSRNLAPEHQTHLLRGRPKKKTPSRRRCHNKREARQQRTRTEDGPHLQDQHAFGVYSTPRAMHIKGGPKRWEAMAHHDAANCWTKTKTHPAHHLNTNMTRKCRSNSNHHHTSRDSYPPSAVEPQHRHKHQHNRSSTEAEPPYHKIKRFLHDYHLQTRTHPRLRGKPSAKGPTWPIAHQYHRLEGRTYRSRTYTTR